MNRVLLVEDDPAVSDALSRRLNACGYRVERAFDAAMATMALRKQSLDVALLDINMPGGDAFIIADRMQKMARAVPFVVMTASDEDGLARKAKQAGAAAFLKKPFNAQQLMDALDRSMQA